MKKIQYDNVKTLADGGTLNGVVSKDLSWHLNDKSQSNGVGDRVR